MRVLVVSHNVFCKTSSMGKTLMSYFKGWNAEDIAQLYIHSEIPTEDMCVNYFRITDQDMIKSIFTRSSGTIFGRGDINHQAIHSRTDAGTVAALYQKGKRRTPFVYFARNLWWALGSWNTKKLRAWLDDFNPDILFLASGDYKFIYKLGLKIAQYKRIPLVISCMDDYYFFNKNSEKFGGKLIHRSLMKQVKRTMQYASCIYPICEKMGKDYGAFFKKPYYTLCTPSMIAEPLTYEKTNAISYIGNFGYKRNEQLIKLGRALMRINNAGKPSHIDVYSAESRTEILKDMTEQNGIQFHGSISSEEVLEVMGRSMAVIHTESFDEGIRKSVAYSVSTKIADSLASGTCILAFGPPEIASIAYLKENQAAFCITEESNLEASLSAFCGNSELREQIAQNAIYLAKKNHDSHKNCQMLRDTMQEVIDAFHEEAGIEEK